MTGFLVPPLDTPIMVNIRSNICIAAMTLVTETKKVTGVSSGAVMLRKVRNRPAPSRAAGSPPARSP